MATPAQITVRIPGHDETRSAAGAVSGRDGRPVNLERFGLKAEVLKGVRVEAARGSGAPDASFDAPGDSVLELAMEGGARLFVRADDAGLRFGGIGERSRVGPGTGTVGIEPVLPLEDARERGGAADWAIKGLRALGIDLPQGGARSVARKADEHLIPEPGLFPWSTGRPGGRSGAPAGAGPLLVFLHGTASSTEGSFGRLRDNAAVWGPLQRRYGERILALEHRTLTRGPIGNALDLVRDLPPGAKLHLVSHSRGGLIGELIARAQRTDDPARPFDERDLALFGHRSAPGRPDADGSGADRSEQLRQLRELDEALRHKRPVVERFVRVACPARGTTLASARLDRWLTLFLNVLGFAADAGTPALGAAYDAVQAFLLAVVKERTDPRTIPGLEAMIPGSPLIALLNRPGVRTEADLSVVEGDAAPSGVLRRLGLWFADAFYGGDHDLVVDRASMTGGALRTRWRTSFARGPAVDHFSYFKERTPTVERVLAGLSRADDESGGFEERANPDDAAGSPAPEMPRLRARGPGDTRPIVYVLPGILGSHLGVGGDRIWIDPFSLAFGGLARLGIDRPGIQVGEPVGLFYRKLCEHLDRTHEVRTWPYDWRRPILDLGATFGRDLSRALRESGRPVRVVAHSMGGLVAGSALLDPAVWAGFRGRDGRLVQLGTPNRGSFAILALLMGRDKLAGYLHAADFTMSARDQLDVLRRFPGILGMLPDDGGPDLFGLETWQEYDRTDTGDLAWPIPEAEDLAEARAFRRAYAKVPFDSGRVLYVAGRGATMDGVTFDPAAPPGRKILFTRTDEGDGQVLWRTGIPRGVRAWYSDAAHGDLPRHEPNFAAIEDLLVHGDTTRLPDRPPAPVRGRASPAPIAREEVEIQPATAEDFALAALGGTPTRTETRGPAVELRVVHGHLASARHPVMVGHYLGDTVAGAEGELDRALGELLSKRRRLGLYAGPIGTSTVVLDGASQPRGGVVVGLGDAATLSAGELERTVRQAVLAYAAACADARRADAVARDGYHAEPAAGALGLSTLLIGAGETGLDRASALLALLRGVARAGSLLVGEQAPVALRELEIVEAVEDRAYEIWHGLRAVLDSGRELAASFTLSEDVARKPGAWRRVNADRDRGRWYPVHVAMTDPGRHDRALSFTVAGGLARAEARVVAANLDVVEPLMHRAIEGAGAPEADATPGRALFELLWPIGLKERSDEDRNLRLVLDEHTARLPWELMDDRRPWAEDGTLSERGDRAPPAVRAGVVRQLVQTGFRERGTIPRGTHKALVIGDPRGAPAAGFAELPGAKREAEAVAALLSGSYDVTPLIGDRVTPEQVMTHLFAQPWEIVHVAAHGVADEPLPGPDGRTRRTTGVVLGGGVVLGPQVLAQLSVVPRLFFINCCHLGRIDSAAEAATRRAAAGGTRPAFAASVAVELIRSGVPAVVAAGWAVEDDVAEAFATSFYGAVLGGTPFGRAVQHARQDAYDRRPTGTTWGAYQCYGEPDWTLPGWPPPGRAPADAGKGKAEPRKFAAAAEAVAVAERIREDANIGLKCKDEELREELRGLERSEDVVRWLKQDEKQGHRPGSGQLHVALGEARAALGDFKEAIEYYDKALKGADTEYKVKAIEQLAHLTAWQEALDYKQAPNDRRDAAKTAGSITAQHDVVAALAAVLDETQERWALRGCCWRRLAQIRGGAQQVEALERMARCYRSARKQPGTERDRAVLLACAAYIALCQHRRRAVPKAVHKVLAEIEDARAGEDADFAQRTLALDAKVLHALADGELDGREEEGILKGYALAWRRGGSPLKLMTALELFEFLEDVMPPPGGPNDAVTAVRRLRVKLTDRFMAGGHGR